MKDMVTCCPHVCPLRPSLGGMGSVQVSVGTEDMARRLSPRLTFDVLGRICSIRLIKCMKGQPSLKFLAKDNVQLESHAQILVNFIITSLASNI